jgi:hypothetical protein
MACSFCKHNGAGVRPIGAFYACGRASCQNLALKGVK